MSGVRELKKEFLEIKGKYLGKLLTRENMDCMWHEYKELFNDFDLDDLKFTLLKSEQTEIIVFNPIRQIDKLAIKGILSL